MSTTQNRKEKRITGLFFGTFDPMHIGHLIIANHLLAYGELDEVWFIITPRSPFKAKKRMLDDQVRFQMVYDAIEPYPRMRASNIEFDLPRPNYTVDTLVRLEERHGEGHAFRLIMGEDNLKSFPKWKNHNAILDQYALVVYPRISEGAVPESLKEHPKVYRVDAPIVQVSSTLVRRMIQEDKDVRPLLPPSVYEEVERSGHYR